MALTDLADVLRAAGLSVVEVPGWKTRGRPGAFRPKGILCHHTAGAADGLGNAVWMAQEGRADLKAPLAQLGLSRTGTVYVLAAGRANHAGKTRAIAGIEAGDGNAQMIGIEAMNTGSEGWTSTQRDAYVRVCAALNRAYGWPVANTLGHKETSLSGKPDPGLLDMDDFRRDVAAAMRPAPVAPAPTPDPDSEEDELMALTVKHPTLKGVRWDADDALWSVWTYAYQAAADAKATLALTKALAQKGAPLTAAETEAIVKEALAEVEAERASAPAQTSP